MLLDTHLMDSSADRPFALQLTQTTLAFDTSQASGSLALERCLRGVREASKVRLGLATKLKADASGLSDRSLNPSLSTSSIPSARYFTLKTFERPFELYK